jgi:S1-C subfamily serine protease
MEHSILTLLLAATLGQDAEPPRLEPAIAAAVLRATVRIHNPAKDEGGSAVVIGKVGPAIYLLTAAHLVAGTDKVELHVFPGEKGKSFRVIADVAVAATTPTLKQDLALLRLSARDDVLAVFIPVRKAGARSIKLPGPAYSAGCSKALSPSVETEAVLDAPLVRKPRADAAVRCFKCKAAPVEGRSGGALVHADGTLLGICSGGDGQSSYYTHVDEIRGFLIRNGLRLLVE